jgi:ABC-type multidrug transport system ATPase subunit
MSSESVLCARDLHVTFPSGQGPVEALGGVDLAIPKGSLFVLLGPNGAGKTTLMRCITGLVRPTRGAMSVFGIETGPVASGGGPVASSGVSPRSTEARARLSRMGVLIENPGLYGRLNAREYLTFFGSFYGLDGPGSPKGRDGLEARIRGLCGELGLALDGKSVAKLSQGNRQKLHLARSLLHRPELLLWDEPTDHLDPLSQRQVLQYLRGYLDDTGATALVATHRLEQMEGAASHFGFLAHGKLLRAGTRGEILGDGDGRGQETARLGFARPLRADELAGLGSELGFEMESPASPASLEADIRGAGLRARLPGIIKAMVLRDLPLASVEPRRPGLAEVYERWLGK